jgi:predicted dehydrogenase
MKIAVIGLGFMGSTHVKAWQSLPGAELLAVVSGDDAKLAGDLSGIQGNLGGPGEKMDFSRVRKYRSANEAIGDPDVEAVDICLPTGLHASVAMAALRAGKHVLVEKPLALNAETANAVIAEAETAGRILMTGQVLRFIPAYRDIAALLASRELGAVRAAFFRRRCAAPAWSKWLADPAQSGGGVFDLLIHDVDYCLHVFGPPRTVTATGYEDLAGGVDWIAANFEYPDSPAVLVTGGWHHPKAYPFSMEFTVVSDGGTLEFSSAGRPLTLYRGDGSEQSLARPEVDIFAEELRYFLDCASAGRQPALCPPRESAQAVRLAEYMLESRKRNGEKIACRF